MKNSYLAVFCSCILLLTAGCSSVRIYSDNGLNARSGLKYYTVKPYVQVERDTETDRVVKATIIYLPDLSNPQYLVMREGFNSKKLNLKFTDGTINTFGYSSTGKTGESIDALSSLITKGTNIIEEAAAGRAQSAVKAQGNRIEFYEVVITPDGTTLREVKIGK